MDYETTPSPAGNNPPRRTDEQIRADIANDPRHQMPEFLNRYEPAVEVQRRGHLLPSEWEVRFDRNNQPIRPDESNKE